MRSWMVVVAVAVSVVDDEQPTLLIKCCVGLPVVSLVRRHRECRRPARPVVALQIDVRVSGAERLPNHVEVAFAVGEQAVVDVRLRIARQPRDRRPSPFVPTPREEVEVAVLLRRPSNPNAAVGLDR